MRKFGRKKQYREMMLRNLVTSMIIFEHVKTTQAKAKETKSLVDKIINIGKENSLASRRKLIGYLTHKNAVKKIIEDLIVRYKDRNSGYCRSYHLKPRIGDGSKMMLLELIPSTIPTKKVDNKTDKIEENLEKLQTNKSINKTAIKEKHAKANNTK